LYNTKIALAGAALPFVRWKVITESFYVERCLSELSRHLKWPDVIENCRMYEDNALNGFLNGLIQVYF